MSLSEKAREAQYKNILRKVKSGKTVPKTELAFLEEFEADQQARPEQPGTPAAEEKQADPFKGWEIPTTQVAVFFQVTPKTIREWAKEGLPRVRYGYFNLSQAFSWWKEHKAGQGGMSRMDALSCTLKKERIKMARLDRKAREGELLPKTQVAETFTARAYEFARAVLEMSHRCAAKIAGKAGKELRAVEKILHAEARRILEEYSRPMEIETE